MGTDDNLSLLGDGLTMIGYEMSESLMVRFAAYLSELALWNPRLRLVAAEGRDLIVRHLLDCAAAVRIIAERLSLPARIVDAGSGAGLPGLVFAMLHPDAEVTLVERSGRRVGFLRNARIAAGVPHVGLFQGDLADYGDGADAMTFRAFLPLNDELLTTISRVVPVGTVFALKGRREAIDAELASAAPAGHGFRVEVVPVDVPYLEEERHLVLLSR